MIILSLCINMLPCYVSPIHGETNPAVEVDDHDTSDDDEPVSGLMSVSW